MFKCKTFTQFILFLLLVSVFSGCTEARKKFIREKNKGKEYEALEPILDPVDYALNVESYPKAYYHHYQMWRVWVKDALYAIYEEESNKRLKYLMDQLSTQLTEMQQLLEDQYKNEFATLIASLDEISAEFNKDIKFRNKHRIKNDLNNIDSMIRSKYNPDNMQDKFKTND